MGLGASPSLMRKNCQDVGKLVHHVTDVFVARIVGEIAVQLALTNYLLFQNFKQGQQMKVLQAAQLAETVDRNFAPAPRLPIPNVN